MIPEGLVAAESLWGFAGSSSGSRSQGQGCLGRGSRSQQFLEILEQGGRIWISKETALSVLRALGNPALIQEQG